MSCARELDPGKDQSYFLFTMRQQKDLAKSWIFPVGNLQKDQVRELGRNMQTGFGRRRTNRTAKKICFVAGKSYSQILSKSGCRRSLLKPGLDCRSQRASALWDRHAGACTNSRLDNAKVSACSQKDPLLCAGDRCTARNEVVVGPEQATCFANARRWRIWELDQPSELAPRRTVHRPKSVTAPSGKPGGSASARR